MRATLHGRIAKPATAVVGVWDPLVPQHCALFAELRDAARGEGRSSVAIVIHPDPAGVIRRGWGTGWPAYDDLKTRIAYLFSCGLDAVLCLHFYQRDTEAGAAHFFELVTSSIDLNELWLGKYQVLGRGVAGHEVEIAELAEQHGVAVRFLPGVTIRPSPYDVRQALVAGRVAQAAAMMGRPPVRTRPASGKLQLAWLPGRYHLIPLAQPTANPASPPIEVELIPEPRGWPSLTWPDRHIRHAAFVSGPGDAAHPESIT